MKNFKEFVNESKEPKQWKFRSENISKEVAGELDNEGIKYRQNKQRIIIDNKEYSSNKKEIDTIVNAYNAISE